MNNNNNIRSKLSKKERDTKKRRDSFVIGPLQLSHHVTYFHKIMGCNFKRVMDKTLTPSPWTTLMDYPNGVP